MTKNYWTCDECRFDDNRNHNPTSVDGNQDQVLAGGRFKLETW